MELPRWTRRRRWHGLVCLIAATDEDIEEIEEFTTGCSIDAMSLCGRWHKEWNSAGYASESMQNPNGGLGTPTYENQKVNNDDVQFSKTSMWHYDYDGNFVNSVPGRCGEYHKVDLGDAAYNYYAGPAPDSPAAIEVGDDGKYGWNGTHGYWMLVHPK